MSGSKERNENGVTRDGKVKVALDRLTGRGNRRPGLIGDVIGRRRKCISIGGTWGNAIRLADVGEGNYFLGIEQNQSHLQELGATMGSTL